jgi:hypothetical protein
VGGRKSAVAHLYLNRLGVRDLWGVFLTHWHLDHTDAAGDLLQAFAHSLKVVGLPPAFSRRELASFLASRLPDEATFAEVRDLTAVMDELAKNSAIHPVLLNDGTVLAQNSMWRLDAIAPSMSDVQHQLQTLAAAVVGTAIKGKYDVNACCAVLVLEVGSTRVLLGSDLANGETPAHGWNAIHQHHPHRLPSAAVKVAHHGSKTSQHNACWAQIANPPPIAVVTPFPRTERPPAARQGRGLVPRPHEPAAHHRRPACGAFQERRSCRQRQAARHALRRGSADTVGRVRSRRTRAAPKDCHGVRISI